MFVDSKDVAMVAATRALFSENGDVVAGLFYTRLFELAPDVREMFPEDLSDQGRKLSATLSVAISSLRNWDELAPVLASLARRHIAYGVQSWHYALVTQALLDTLKGAGVDAATVAAWNRVMSVINAHMIASAYGNRLPGAASANKGAA